MLYVIPIAPPRKKKPTRTAPPAPPVLVAATYESTTAVTLVFDQAVDATAMDGASVSVVDGEEQVRLIGDAIVATLSPTTVRVTLHVAEADQGDGVVLSVDGANGLVAAGGAAWAGCVDVALPFSL